MKRKPKISIRTFEEQLLTAEEQEEKRKRDEEDKELAAFYRSVFEDPESFFAINENQIDDVQDYDE